MAIYGDFLMATDSFSRARRFDPRLARAILLWRRLSLR